MGDVDADQLKRLRMERDLYLRLLDLGSLDEIEPFLREALGLVTELTGAKSGYLEIHGADRDGDRVASTFSWGFVHDDSVDASDLVSRGIIDEVLATGTTIDTPSARLDHRFSERGSVQALELEAVLCLPIGDDPTVGVLYLQGRDGDGPFAANEREWAGVFAHRLARIAESLIIRVRSESKSDPTAPLRRSLKLDGVVGRSTALASLLQEVKVVSPLDVSLLLTGESGTGKSQIARVIHDNGPRATQPFVEVNCAALPETLIESELFGAMAGSHSTATRETTGKVAAAEGGTLFLDEIAELTPGSQAKLLQLLQSREYYPLGASQPMRADVRIVAATNADLEAAVEEKRFRSDLYYRLQVLPVRVPSLSEREDDVPLLAEHFRDAASMRYKLPALGFSPSAILALCNATWPGQIRQLSHAVEAALIRASGQSASKIERAHVFPENTDSAAENDASLTFQEATRRFQAELLSGTLEEAHWNVTEASRRLDLTRSHVYNLIRTFGLSRS